MKNLLERIREYFKGFKEGYKYGWNQAMEKEWLWKELT